MFTGIVGEMGTVEELRRSEQGARLRVSARLAAEAVLEGDLAGYESRVIAELGPLHAASWTAKYALDRFPRLTFAIARVPLGWGVIARIVRGELKDPTAAHGLARAPLKALDRLGKIARTA